MAYYISSKIPIKGFQKAFLGMRDELYSDLTIDYELKKQLDAYVRDNKTLETKEEKAKIKKEKEFIAGLIFAFLSRKSKFRGIGYYLMLDAIVKTHVDNYKPVLIQQSVGKTKEEIAKSWSEEINSITTTLGLDKTINHDWHSQNIEKIKENSFKNLAKYVANAYIINSAIDSIQKFLNKSTLQNQSIIRSIGGIIPDENMRLYNTIRTNKVEIAKYPISISKSDGRWNRHQWVSYTRTDFPCYGVDGEIRKVGEKFSNGFVSPKIHVSCYCTLKPIS